MSKNITAPSDRQFHTVGTCSLRERQWKVTRLECEWPVEANPGVAQPVSAPPPNHNHGMCLNRRGFV
jgi:hypothetical protein